MNERLKTTFWLLGYTFLAGLMLADFLDDNGIVPVSLFVVGIIHRDTFFPEI